MNTSHGRRRSNSDYRSTPDRMEPHTMNTSHGRRGSSSDYRSTPDRFPYSPSSTYSAASTVKNRNPVAVAARSVAGVFVACFTPPETATSKSIADSEDYKSPSVKSDVSGAGFDRRRASNRGVYLISNNSTNGEPGNLRFTIEDIYKATKNFSPNFKIGQGGFGTVYKGRLADGTFVAIKRAKKSLYDKHLGTEFQSEIRTLAQVEHLNLVKFYGYLEQKDERIVVVEYVPNGTLREHLDCLRGNILDLATRLDIAIDVAHAVTYLHMYTDHPIIHRDIKSSNILITENFRAKVADFGFARLAADSDSGATHAMKMFSDGDATSTIDPKLEKTEVNYLTIEKLFELALQCLAPRRQNRPSMRKCAEILWSIRRDYRETAVSDFRSYSTRSLRSASTKEE
ncbi:hypothetical protein FEM48_Zijuj12G0160100 [Ziziphus jujuba var. spinosa]|uniref:Protein kinase domain-containing protein n=1 Tax=Ziziphus jujuba var. spinosa TaxID=714518 RepID=A0A978UEA2_ZIZJJ|nr:hypothetical protein FEM48_Zijuj12G0160100 [Ziziphus jujuba var. spinosa]